MKLPLIGLFLFSVLCLQGEVFSLWPYRAGTESASSKWSELSGYTSKDPLFSEKMTVNGIPVSLESYLLTLKPSELLALLKKNFHPKQLEIGKDFLRASNKLPSGKIERFLFLFSEHSEKITVFRMETPEKLPKITDWPSELPPLPSGAEPEQVIRFSERNAVYGSFVNGPPNSEFTLSFLAQQCRSRNFVPLTTEHKSAFGGKGELFWKEHPRQLLWVNFSNTGNGAYYWKNNGEK